MGYYFPRSSLHHTPFAPIRAAIPDVKLTPNSPELTYHILENPSTVSHREPLPAVTRRAASRVTQHPDAVGSVFRTLSAYERSPSSTFVSSFPLLSRSSPSIHVSPPAIMEPNSPTIAEGLIAKRTVDVCAWELLSNSECPPPLLSLPRPPET